jgi:Protein of unknown function (DUF2797)
MKHSGNIRKMRTELDKTVIYQLPVGDDLVNMNALIGKAITLQFNHAINCVACNRKTKKSFNQGFCYPCFQKLAQCDMCIMKPELCHYAEGSCREPQWGEQHCFKDHFVYLANSSGIKVGITRGTQIPTRWMDQGATQALPIFRVKDRLTSGMVEVIMKNHVNDKTHWQRMLKGQAESQNLIQKRDELYELCKDELNQLKKQQGDDALTYLDNESMIDIHYPVTEYPEKVKSFNFDKTEMVSGVLQGIKGQYLILDTGVLNIRKFGGYNLTLEF